MKYSACYVKVNPNFVIDNVNANFEIDKNFKALFAICKNIILRGCPSKPSFNVEKVLGKPNEYKNYKYVDSNKILDWSRTIKGANGYNPALEFYNKSLVKSTNKDLLNTFIPECKFSDIINTLDNVNDLYVDFYSPYLKCVVEIDGNQHNKSDARIIDKERDKALNDVGVEVIRIPTNLIGYPIFKLQRLTQRYIQTNDKIIDLTDDDKNYMALIRYQMLFLELLESGNISVNDKDISFEIIQNEDIDSKIFNIAYYDLFELITNVANLLNISFEIPQLNYLIVDNFSSTKSIKIDLDIYSKYCDYPSDKVIYIRNDYFKYDKNANYKVRNDRNNVNRINKYVSYKNYYKVSNGEVSYKLNQKDENHHKSLLYILKYLFNFDSFYAKQEEIIIRCLNTGSVVGLLPTGAGKSLCYQLTSFLLPGITLVVSPLTILMEDQAYNMENRHNISNITYVNRNNRNNIDIALSNQAKILLISPERFFNEKFLSIFKLNNININFVTIDEVHCISEWGHDFRTSYLCLNYYFKANLNSKTKLMGLTATASTRVCQDILAEFQTFKKNTTLIQADSLNRENLNLHVECIEYGEKYEKLMDYLKNKYKNDNKDKTVVFNVTKGNTKNNYGCIDLSACAKKELKIDNYIDYFAGGETVDYNENSMKLENFKKGNLRLLFATKAFGMGVDIPNIRRTIHYNLPGSIESLYQEFGRAGRDGKTSDCIIYYYKEQKQLFNEVFNFNGRKRIDSIARVSDIFKEFNTILFFLTKSYLDIEIERELIIVLYNFVLEKSKIDENVSFSYYEFCDYLNKEKLVNSFILTTTLVDKFLYRLYILNLISIWSMSYGEVLENPIYTNIKVKKIDTNKQIIAINNYIRKYKANYDYKGESNAKSILNELLTWIYDNFVYHKLQSIKNVYEICQNYKDSKQFMKSIVDYLVIDTNIDKLVKNPDEYMHWFQILQTYNSSELKMILARYLEVDDFIVSLNYVSGLLRLQLNEFDDLDGKRRLVLAFETIKDYSEETIDDILQLSLKYLSDENKSLFVETIMEWNEEYAYKLNRYVENDLVKAKIILDFSKKIIEIGGNIYDKFRED